MIVHELALVHEFSEFMTVHEQPMFKNNVRVHEHNKFMNFYKSIMTVYEHVHERS